MAAAGSHQSDAPIHPERPGRSDRYDVFRRIARDQALDGVALVPGANFARLYGKTFLQNERPLVIVIPVEGLPAAVVPNLELASFALLGFEGAVFDWRDQDGYDGAFAALAAHRPMRRLGVEGQQMRVFVHHALARAFDDLELVDAQRAISGPRLRKSAGEIAAMERAIGICQGALADTLAGVCVGMFETEIEALLKQSLFAHGAQDFAFSPIVAAGDNSARPHASARPDYAVRPGDALLLDFGVSHDGVCADITRTVFVRTCGDEQRAFYDTVLRANRCGRDLAAAGVSAHDLDDAVSAVLERSPFASYMRTRTGHGLGREVHEEPYIMRGNHTPLEAGMVFTIEPGLYKLGGFGVRIEDDVLITPEGATALTDFTREIMFVG